ncbi:MAG: hypothetical protein R2845_10235 [Thermomicrobiales bacterium]
MVEGSSVGSSTDFANVLFSITVVSLYFPIWLTDEAGGGKCSFALISSISMAIVFVLAQRLVGALSRSRAAANALADRADGYLLSGNHLPGKREPCDGVVLFVIANSSYLLALLCTIRCSRL